MCRTRCQTHALTRKSLDRALKKHPNMTRQLLSNAHNLGMKQLSIRDIEMISCGPVEVLLSVQRGMHPSGPFVASTSSSEASARVEMDDRSCDPSGYPGGIWVLWGIWVLSGCYPGAMRYPGGIRVPGTPSHSRLRF